MEIGIAKVSGEKLKNKSFEKYYKKQYKLKDSDMTFMTELMFDSNSIIDKNPFYLMSGRKENNKLHERGKSKQCPKYLEDQIYLENPSDYYIKEYMWTHAADSIAKARRTIKAAASTEDVSSFAGPLMALDRIIKEGQAARQDARRRSRPHERGYEDELIKHYTEQSLAGFDVRSKIDQGGRDELKSLIGDVERLLWDVTGSARKLVTREFSDKVSDSLAVSMVSWMLVGYEIEDVLDRYGISRNEINSAWLLKMRAEIKRLKRQKNVNSFLHPVRLAYCHYEFTSLFDQLAEADLQKDKKIFGTRLSPHKVTFLVDKDATIEVPGRVLKQVALQDGKILKPSRALDIITQAILGANVNILTGSTTKEGFEHVLDPIARVMVSMKIPRVMQRLAIARIKVLANDGTAVMQMEMSDNHKIVLKPIVANLKYVNGKWVEASTIIKKNGETENKENRIIVWENSIQAYLRQLFSEETPLALLGVSDEPGERALAKREIQEFLKALKLTDADLPGMLDDVAKANYLTFRESISSILGKMLNNMQDSGPSGANAKWLSRFQEILQSRETATKKLLDVKGAEALTNDEQLFAAVDLLHLKESSGTYASLSGDALDEQRQHDDRVSGLQELVLNRGFWSGTREFFDNEMWRAVREGRFLDQNGELIDFTSRAGPGYLNLSFGGVSKKNFLTGMLEDNRTKGHVVLITGDSITDQGEFPQVITAPIAPEKVEDMRAALKDFQAEFPGQYGSERLSIDVDKTTGAISLKFKGVMTKRRWTKVKEKADPVLFPAVDAIYQKTRLVQQERIPVRVLLGTLFEVDEQKIESLMSAGLVRTQYKSAAKDPFGNGLTNERWGPAGFYALIKATMAVAAKEYVLPTDDDTYFELDRRDRFVRALIEELNRELTGGFSVIPPETMKTVMKSRAVSAAANDAMAQPDRKGGIDLNPAMVQMDIQRDGNGVVLPVFQQPVKNIQVDGFLPEIIRVVPADNLPMIIGLSDEETPAMAASLEEHETVKSGA